VQPSSLPLGRHRIVVVFDVVVAHRSPTKKKEHRTVQHDAGTAHDNAQSLVRLDAALWLFAASEYVL
jgi:hypothetical protein